MIRKVSDEQAKPIASLNPETPDWLIAIVAKLQAKNPDDRYQSTGEVAELLSRHLAELQQPTPAAKSALRPPSRNRRRVVTLACLGAMPVAGAAIAVAVFLWNRESPKGDLAVVGAGPEKSVPLQESQSAAGSTGGTGKATVFLQQAEESLRETISRDPSSFLPRHSNLTLIMPTPTKCVPGNTSTGRITSERSPTSASVTDRAESHERLLRPRHDLCNFDRMG